MPPVPSANLAGQTVMVIGANAGIGFEACKHFARMNPGRLIMACRNKQKGEAAILSLVEDTGYTKAELWLIDLASFESVRAFVDKFKKDGGRLDILVANAGIVPSKYKETGDGWEESIQVNNLSTSLLCLLLAPHLVETGTQYRTRPRIVLVTSSAHYYGSFMKDEAYNCENIFRYCSREEHRAPSLMVVHWQYVVTKLLHVFFMHSLSDLLKGTPVVVNGVCPGLCKSGLLNNISDLRDCIVDSTLNFFLARSPEEGSRAVVYCAVGSPEHPEKLHGEYVERMEIVEPSDHVLGDDGKQRRDKVWNDLIRELAKVDDRIPGIVNRYS